MERSLFGALNAERTAKNLPLLRPSPVLDRLSRRQSRDMAALKVLTHASARGLSYADRLFEAKAPYRAFGENVVRSETFVTDLIHASIMNSPPHRENVLNPDFDEVGIGVVQGSDRAYYITQDFLRSFVPRAEPEVSAVLLRGIGEIRSSMSLPALEWVEELDASARAFARARALGPSLKAVPEEYRTGRIFFHVGPDLAEIAEAVGKKSAAPFVRGGLGAWFDRTPEYPGGAYHVCTIFLPAEKFAGLDRERLAGAVLKAANGLREGNELVPVDPDSSLSRIAAAFGREGLKNRPRKSGRRIRGFVAAFETSEPEVFQAALISALEDASYRRIGISVAPVLTKWGSIEKFVVAVVLDR